MPFGKKKKEKAVAKKAVLKKNTKNTMANKNTMTKKNAMAKKNMDGVLKAGHMTMAKKVTAMMKKMSAAEKRAMLAQIRKG
jgi:hypothetical protein